MRVKQETAFTWENNQILKKFKYPRLSKKKECNSNNVVESHNNNIIII